MSDQTLMLCVAIGSIVGNVLIALALWAATATARQGADDVARLAAQALKNNDELTSKMLAQINIEAAKVYAGNRTAQLGNAAFARAHAGVNGSGEVDDEEDEEDRLV